MKAGLFEFSFIASEAIEMPKYNKGNIFRGALGQSLKHLVCPRPTEYCKNCQVRKCIYRELFDSKDRTDVPKLTKNEDLPRPYVIRPPMDRRSVVAAGESFHFEIALFGNTVDLLPYLLVTLTRAAEGGIGINRGRASLESVTQKDPVSGRQWDIFSKSDGVIKQAGPFFSEHDFAVSEARGVRIDFLTPAILKNDGMFLSVPSFEAIVKRLRDRYSSLSWFFEGIEPEMDFRGYAEAATQVRAVKMNTRYLSASRARRNRDQRHDMSGFVGSAEFEGPVSPYLRHLLFGQYMHVGKSAVFGFGMYRVEAIR